MIPSRRLRSAGTAALLALAVALVVATPVAATRKWCRKDPGFLINRQTEVNVEIAPPEDQQEVVTGPLDVTLFVPRHVPAKITFTDEGFNNHGEDVLIVHEPRLDPDRDSIPFRVRVLVPANRVNVPVAIFVTTSEGTSTRTVTKTNRLVEVRSSISTGD